MENDIRKFIGILSQATNQQWFRRMRNDLIAEDLWKVVETPYLTVVPSTANTPTTSAGSTPSAIPSSGTIWEDAKATFDIQQCLDENDDEDTATMNTAYAIWKFLNNKYKEKFETTGNLYLREYIEYKNPIDVGVEDARTLLKKLGQEIVSTQGDMGGMCRDARLLWTLLFSLPEDYTVIRDAILVQPAPDLDFALLQLLEEAQLKA